MALRKAGKPSEAVRMLSTLSEAAVNTNNFREAAYYYWMLAVESGKLYPEGSDRAHVEAGRKLYGVCEHVCVPSPTLSPTDPVPHAY